METFLRAKMGLSSTKGLLFMLTLGLSLFSPAKSTCGIDSPCQTETVCRSGKCSVSTNRFPSSTSTLAAVTGICTVLMLCFGILLCYACYRQCKECRGGSRIPENEDESINTITQDITCIDIPEDFFRHSRIPSAENYSGPPPYLCLFNPVFGENGDEGKPPVSRQPTNVNESESVELDTRCTSGVTNRTAREDGPPDYNLLFAKELPTYNEVVITTN